MSLFKLNLNWSTWNERIRVSIGSMKYVSFDSFAFTDNWIKIESSSNDISCGAMHLTPNEIIQSWSSQIKSLQFIVHHATSIESISTWIRLILFCRCHSIRLVLILCNSILVSPISFIAFQFKSMNWNDIPWNGTKLNEMEWNEIQSNGTKCKMHAIRLNRVQMNSIWFRLTIIDWIEWIDRIDWIEWIEWIEWQRSQLRRTVMKWWELRRIVI
jgi:hypothetical protein